MNLPQPTDDAESATGQLRLLSFGDYAHNNHGPLETVDEVRKRISEEEEQSKRSKKFKLHVVHRLDCQVSNPSYFKCAFLVVHRRSSLTTRIKSCLTS
jgi:hypothetical protein